MNRFSRHFSFVSSSSLDPEESAGGTRTLDKMDVPSPVAVKIDGSKPGILTRLPPELTDAVLSFLDPLTLASLLATSHALRSHAQNELLWRRFVLDNLPAESNVSSPHPAPSWRDLYTAHYPYWFLVRQRFWFSDTPLTGSLVVAEYDARRGCIEAYRLLARQEGPITWKKWEHNPAVHVHNYVPKITLLLDDPIIKLNLNKEGGRTRLYQEYAMHTGQTPGIATLLSLCKPIPSHLQDRSMSLWPPSTIPTDHRVRNQSPRKFREDSHRPHTLSEASDQTFRLRKLMRWSQMIHPLSNIHIGRMGEDVSTFSAIPTEWLYPTAEKPYQGLWVGDYSSHGSEFLLVMQSDSEGDRNLSRCSSTESLPQGTTIRNTRGYTTSTPGDGPTESTTATAGPSSSQEYIPLGRIEAIKLTGDFNVPRGECSWFADDISDNGLVRVATEELFKGARIVKSMGHIASQGYRDDRYIHSQLIMVSHDLLAQFWEACFIPPILPLAFPSAPTRPFLPMLTVCL